MAKDAVVEDEAINITALPASLALRRAWRPEVGDWEALQSKTHGLDYAAPQVTQDYAALVAALGHPGSSTSAAENFCAVLRSGGHASAEAACEHGAIEAATMLLRNDTTQLRAVEALWFLVDDYGSCQSLIQSGGQKHVLKLARERGAEDATFAVCALRLLSESLYGETRSADLWGSSDVDFVIDAFGWALTADEAQAHVADPACVLLCDIAALWVLRATGQVLDAARALLGIIPLLLQKMSSRSEDYQLLQHGCRLLHALAKKSEHWPADLRQPVLAALGQLNTVIFASQDSQVVLHGQMALQAINTLPEMPKDLCLSSMD